MFEKLKQIKDEFSFSLLMSYMTKPVFVIFFSYLVADVATSSLIPSFLKVILSSRSQKSSLNVSRNVSGDLNYFTLKKDVLKRNLFNQTGELPFEGDLVNKKASSFDLSSPCQKSSLNLTLIGTIFKNDNHSVATVREKGIDTADIYNVGDFIIGQDKAQVVDIIRNQLIINNNGRKECLQLKVADEKFAKSTIKKVAETIRTSLDGDYVDSLEEKMVESARIGPGECPKGRKSLCWMISQIKSGSIFEKIGFKRGDLITQVNGKNLGGGSGGDASMIYSAFKNESTIKISFLRKGIEPKTIVVKIK